MVRLAFLLPVVCAWWSAATLWPDFHFSTAGSAAISNLLLIAGTAIVFAGVQFAARAVCWEVSNEMRDLVRLTGVGAATVLWSKSLARWWTIGLAVLLILPLASFARTMGGVTSGQLVAGACGLSMVTAITGGVAMLSGVLAASAKNPEKTATGTAISLLLIYNLAFVIAALTVYAWDVAVAPSPLTHEISRQVVSLSPAAALARSLQSPDSFSVTAPQFWIHFPVAIGAAWLATLMMKFRFQRSPQERVEESDSGGLSSVPFSRPDRTNEACPDADVQNARSRPATPLLKQSSVAPGRRPRCSDRPFFWKDVYILSDERGRVNAWSVAYVLAAIAIVGLLFLISNHPGDRGMRSVIAFVSIAAAAVVVSLRFDALLTIEFRERTWGSLMLLPVDPCEFLWIKLKAAVWEQRYGAIPIGVAQLGLILFETENLPGAVMAAVIAIPCGGLLCQMSALSQLMNKVWWLGPCQAIGFIAVTIGVIFVWVQGGLFPGFLLATGFLAAVVYGLHIYSIKPATLSWVEAD